MKTMIITDRGNALGHNANSFAVFSDGKRETVGIPNSARSIERVIWKDSEDNEYCVYQGEVFQIGSDRMGFYELDLSYSCVKGPVRTIPGF